MNGIFGISPVMAYLDPGTGAMIISAIVGVFATLALAIKTYSYKFIGLFKRRNKQHSDQAGEEGKGEAGC